MRKSTEKQRSAVKYCELWLHIEFDGDINNFNDCSLFLSIYLEEAKQTEMELKMRVLKHIFLGIKI